jgi:hypothetical protein
LSNITIDTDTWALSLALVGKLVFAKVTDKVYSLISSTIDVCPLEARTTSDPFFSRFVFGKKFVAKNATSIKFFVTES